jgi:hypothetical protein
MTDININITGNNTDTDDRTAMIAARLKQLYSKSILPVEKKYRYDYFFDSPLLSDVEFDGTIFEGCLKSIFFLAEKHSSSYVYRP